MGGQDPVDENPLILAALGKCTSTAVSLISKNTVCGFFPYDVRTWVCSAMNSAMWGIFQRPIADSRKPFEEKRVNWNDTLMVMNKDGQCMIKYIISRVLK